MASPVLYYGSKFRVCRLKHHPKTYIHTYMFIFNQSFIHSFSLSLPTCSYTYPKTLPTTSFKLETAKYVHTYMYAWIRTHTTFDDTYFSKVVQRQNIVKVGPLHDVCLTYMYCTYSFSSFYSHSYPVNFHSKHHK